MKINDKTRVKPLIVNNKYIIIRYEDYTPNRYQLQFECNLSTLYPRIYAYDNGSSYIFGTYDEKKSIFEELSHLNIKEILFNFLLEKVTNLESKNY